MLVKTKGSAINIRDAIADALLQQVRSDGVAYDRRVGLTTPERLAWLEGGTDMLRKQYREVPYGTWIGNVRAWIDSEPKGGMAAMKKKKKLSRTVRTHPGSKARVLTEEGAMFALIGLVVRGVHSSTLMSRNQAIAVRDAISEAIMLMRPPTKRG